MDGRRSNEDECEGVGDDGGGEDADDNDKDDNVDEDEQDEGEDEDKDDDCNEVDSSFMMHRARNCGSAMSISTANRLVLALMTDDQRE